MFKRKRLEIPKEVKLLAEYIIESRKLLIDDIETLKKFKRKNYPDNFIEHAFILANESLPLKRIERGNLNMTKKEEYDEEEDEEFDDEEDLEDDEEEEEEEKPALKKKKTKKIKEKASEIKPIETPEINQLDILGNHEQRLSAIEAALFRVKGSI